MPAAKECPSSMFPATASTSCLYLHSIIRPPRKWQVLRLLFSADLFIIDKTHYKCGPFSDKR